MKRKIITIDEEKCTGCGMCVPDCPEGALQIIDGKARLVGELLCDGLGACMGSCPEGAITVEEREAEAYDERRVMENIIPQGAAVIRAHLEHLKIHGEDELLRQARAVLDDRGIALPEPLIRMHPHHHPHGGGCPGSASVTLPGAHAPARVIPDGGGAPSRLGQWPVQLRLVNPAASYFNSADLLVAADCTAFARGDFHDRFLDGKILLVFCPKLDHDPGEYVKKLAEIFTLHDVRSVTLVRMEVPCCGGLSAIVQEALRQSGNSMILREYVLTLRGEIA